MKYAAWEGHVECLKELIAAGADVNKEKNAGATARMYAADIAAGADINKENKRWWTQLCILLQTKVMLNA